MKKCTADQEMALTLFKNSCKERNIQDWKGKLIESWMNGRYPFWTEKYSYLLQQVRNQFGPSWLKNY